jgi:hypothetical protein
MKNRVVGLGVVVIFLLISLTGCFAAIPFLIAGEVALNVIDLKEAMKAVEVKATFDVASHHVWNAAIAATEEMKIEIIEKAFDQEKGSGIIKGKTNKHQNIQLIIVADTLSVTSIGVKARVREVLNMPVSASDVDRPFAKMIVEKLAAHLEKITGEKQEIRW